MELDGGGCSTRRRRLQDDGRDAWTGLTLGAVLGNDKISGTSVQVSRTLLDIIRDEEPNTGAYKNLINHHNNKKNWKSFKDRLRLRRAGAAWTSSVHSPTSDAAPAIQNSRSVLSRHNSTRMPATVVPNSSESAEDGSEQVTCDISTQTRRPQMTRRFSTRVPSSTAELTQSAAEIESDEPPVVETVPVSDVPVQNIRSQMLRRNSSRLPLFTSQSTQSDPFNEYEPAAPSVRLSEALAAEREQIQRVVSSSEAETENAFAETAEEVAAPSTEAAAGQQPVRMSLMDLLEETDRQMGWVSYSAAAAEEEENEEQEEEDGGDDHDKGKGGGREYTCCVCMVRHKGAAFIPCGHTFCRLCSRELWVSRGNCPLCNGFILEILDIF